MKCWPSLVVARVASSNGGGKIGGGTVKRGVLEKFGEKKMKKENCIEKMKKKCNVIKFILRKYYIYKNYLGLHKIIFSDLSTI